jgi:hypothetical protein
MADQHAESVANEPWGVWLAFYRDWSGLAVFATEVEALRYAVGKGMAVAFAKFGEDLREAVR